MPAPIKLALSVLVLAVAATIYQLRDLLDSSVPPLLVPALGLFMVFSLWVFPEAARRHERK